MITIAAQEIGIVEAAEANHLLDAMLDAQGRVGQITWINLSEGVAKGTYWRQTSNPDVFIEERIVVTDPAEADVDEAIDATIWAHNN
ncbi:hypothetical protein SEA_PUPPER_197 [Gordonia phage Pupper]|uniref:Uncharacterized protein n=1 Tax=Gordonia phage Pupper TaxID=2571249 RepID=A0A4Y6EIY8_9CAUD|nr:hypothetical protein KHQ83_gp080 [Gordonia phage Pupper]QDF18683.1 hypothetical protein SEA_PUPPER_197 [Gordonia phage Pupper]QDF18915.1 hypothetical protein SEA_SCENTAE_196 [Gordonia phage SCentae]